jgi:site-specific recombinase XerD
MIRKPWRPRVVGPLAPYRASFEAALTRAGYAPQSVSVLTMVMARLSRWLLSSRLSPGDLSPDVVSAFVNAQRAAGYARPLSPRGLRPLLDHLRGLGAAPVVGAVEGPVEELTERFRRYLASERGLAPSTVDQYAWFVRGFLARFCVAGDPGRLSEVDACAVAAFVVEQSRRPKAGMKYVVVALRSLLRFLVVDGVLARDLSASVPTAARWRQQGLARGLASDQVLALLASCDVSRPVGRRDLAILTLLLRLGLRAGEVAGLRLEDFDWRHGELAVRGKGRREERLPIPPDVGQAVVAYLRGANNRGAAREVFLTVLAPVRPLTAKMVSGVVRNAGFRVGLGQIGAHRLRHTAATEMLRAGTPLVEVGQVLRHRDVATTTIYAKVDRIALRALARPWPGVTA